MRTTSMLSPKRLLLSLSTAYLLTSPASAHSWLEQLQIISSNGSYAGDMGYPRGYMARTDPGFNGYSDKWQLPSPDYDLGRTRINSTDFLCHPAQRTANYSSQYPKLQVAPDSYVAMRYLENGHVTQPWIPAGKPADSGTVFVYGTYSPSAEEKIADVLQWTTDGTGGNGKGFLMTAQNYDDGRCHQPNSAPISIERQMNYPDKTPGQEAWCETDLHIPANSNAGSTLSLYWVWSWATSPATEGAPCGKDEYYTTCADVDIVGSGTTQQKLVTTPGTHTLVQQDPQVQAVSDYKSRTAYASTPYLVTTEGCSQTSVTSSSLPATLTQLTSLPANYMATFTQGAVSASSTAQAPQVSSSSPASSQIVHQATTTVTAYSIQTVTVYPSTSSSSLPYTLPAAQQSSSIRPEGRVIDAPADAVAGQDGFIREKNEDGHKHRKARHFVG